MQMPKILELTVSGKDAGGYIWENVLHFSTDNAGQPDALDCDALNTQFITNVEDALLGAMNESTSILNYGSRVILPTPSFTVNTPSNSVGTQVGSPSVGALCGKISFYPDNGKLTGRMFVAGPVDEDFTADEATTAYMELLTDIVTGLLVFDGSLAPFDFQFGLFSKGTQIFVPFTSGKPRSSPGVLSKRIRV